MAGRIYLAINENTGSLALNKCYAIAIKQSANKIAANCHEIGDKSVIRSFLSFLSFSHPVKLIHIGQRKWNFGFMN